MITFPFFSENCCYYSRNCFSPEFLAVCKFESKLREVLWLAFYQNENSRRPRDNPSFDYIRRVHLSHESNEIIAMTDQKFFEITKNLEKLKVSVTRGLAEAQSEIENLREDLKNNDEYEKLEDLENNLKKYAGLYHWHGILFEDFVVNFDSIPKKLYDERIKKLKNEFSEKEEQYHERKKLYKDRIKKLKDEFSEKEELIKSQNAKINELQQYQFNIQQHILNICQNIFNFNQNVMMNLSQNFQRQ